MAVIFTASSQSDGGGDRVPDYLTHALVYLFLCLLACRALAGGLGRPLTLSRSLLAVVFCLGYGVTDEIHQSFVPGRHPSGGDVAKDLLGAALGAAVYWRFSPAPLSERAAKEG